MHDRGDRGHDAGKDLRSRRKAKTESAELVDRLSHAKPEVTARRWMNRNLKVGILEIQGYQPIPFPKGLKNGLGGLHMKMGDIHKAVQAREVDHRTAKSPNDPLDKPPPHWTRDMTPTVENPAYHPEEQKREQESRNRLSSQDEKESQNYDDDSEQEKSEQESGKDWSAADSHQNLARPHQPWPAENKAKKKSEYPPTGEVHQTPQRETWRQPQEPPTSHAR